MPENNTVKQQISKEGLEKYLEELNYLKGERRAEIAEKIKDAREQGDLSENAEYDAAKDEQREIELRIETIENIIKNAEVVEKSDLKRGTIGVGSHVKLFDLKEKEEIEYDIVGASEANSLNGKISNESPLGKELLGKRKGDVVEIQLTRGKLKVEILKVS
ncbi:MAG: transcription elongation factor GreA [Lachnospiraceae bacterium]|nr:transcription elongation factor GreA [Lachnospiraceae bacterium]MBR1844849.1 transcription elongation factor GreA [Lachnospiraceae bacterium]